MCWSERHLCAELEDASVHNQRGYPPPRAIDVAGCSARLSDAVAEIQHAAGVQCVVHVSIPSQSHSAASRLDGFGEPQVESSEPIFKVRLRGNQRNGGGRG